MEVVYLAGVFLLVMGIASIAGTKNSINSYYEFPVRFLALYLGTSVLIILYSNLTLTVPDIYIYSS